MSSWKDGADLLDPLAIDWQRYSKANFPGFRLRQRPAVSNALGRVKFIFPNRFSVYIHDTPAKSLFHNISRSFSAGCVRIEKPQALAKYLLAGQGWNAERVTAKIKSRKRVVVTLEAPVPVHLVYLTAWADEKGTVYFYQDLYGRDRPLLAALKPINPELPDFTTDVMKVDRIIEDTTS
ncbi:MAG: L,D-transpeptidase family protein [Desulfobacteraceae bacterium]